MVLVNRDGFRPDPDKIEPMINFPVPKNLKELHRFVGMATWYRKFLKVFATITEPLTALTKKDRRYECRDTQQDAFEKIKALVPSAPVLARPSFDAQFVVQTDASDTGIGAVLLQIINGQERVSEFASRTLSLAERNYSVSERECLAVIWTIKKIHPYIEGYYFLVVTDHSSLRWLHNPTGTQGHSFEVEHRKGALNHVPDALSRMFEEDMISTCARVRGPTIPRTNGMGPIIFRISEHYHEIMRELHDDPTAGHQSREKTYERAARLYYWPKMYHCPRAASATISEEFAPMAEEDDGMSAVLERRLETVQANSRRAWAKEGEVLQAWDAYLAETPYSRQLAGPLANRIDGLREDREMVSAARRARREHREPEATAALAREEIRAAERDALIARKRLEAVEEKRG